MEGELNKIREEYADLQDVFRDSQSNNQDLQEQLQKIQASYDEDIKTHKENFDQNTGNIKYP